MFTIRILKVNDPTRQIQIFGQVVELNITSFGLNLETTHDNLYKYIIISFLFFLATCVPYRAFLSQYLFIILEFVFQSSK